MLSQFEIEKSHFVVSEVGGQLDVDLLSAVQTSPLGVVVLGLAEFSHLLNECLSLLEAIKFKSLSERIEVTRVGPTLNTSSINNVSDSSLIHFLKLINTSLVELFKISIQLVEIGGRKGEAAGHLGGNLCLLTDWN